MRKGILIAGASRGARAYGRLLRELAPDVPCYFWCEDVRSAQQLDERLQGSGWFNSLEAAFADDRIRLILLMSDTRSLDQALALIELVKNLGTESEPCEP